MSGATVADAVATLAARTGHGGGFRREDIAAGHRLAAVVHARGALGEQDQRTAHALLGRYRDALLGAGVDYDALPTPPPVQPAPEHRQGSPSSRVGVRGGRIFTATPYRYADAMRAVAGGRWHKTAKCRSCATGRCPFPRLDGWHYPATPSAAVAIDDALAVGGYVDDEPFRALLASAATATDARRLRGRDDLPPVPGLITKAWAHQRQAYWYGVNQPGVLLDMEMGEQPSGAAVLTPSGWKSFGSLAVGDHVIGADGLPVEVVEVKPWVRRERWVVHTSDGAAVACSPNHLWATADQSGAFRTMPLADIEATLGGPRWSQRRRLPALDPVEGRSVDLPLDPYVLGIILAEGAASGGRLRFRCSTPAIVEEVRRRGYAVSTDQEGTYHNLTGLKPTKLLAALGLTGALSATKRVPAVYLQASREQRHALLQGLMDGDGSSVPRSAYYSTISPGLAQDVSALARSLGGSGSVWQCARAGEWRCTLGLPFEVAPFLASGRASVRTRRTHRRIERIERTGVVEPMRCIRVANPDGLYVTDGYVLTHNTGKSLVAVGLLAAKAPRSALILCPSRVIGVWPKQFAIHAGTEAFHAVDGRRIKRTGRPELMKIADRVAAFSEALDSCDCGRPHICITNYAATTHEPFRSWALQQPWDAAIYDEVHKIKSPSGKWSRWCGDLGQRVPFRAGLTGTLIPHSPLDVFGQVRAIDAGVFGTTWTAFKSRYAETGGYEGKEVVGVKASMEQELADRVSNVTYRVGPEVLDLPKEVPDVNLSCQIGPKAQRLYTAIEQQMYAEVLGDDGEVLSEVTAANVLVKLLRLAQITGGAIRDDEGQDVEVDTAKEDLLSDVLSDIADDKPVVVFCRFRHDLDVIERVAQSLGRTYAELSGRRDDALAADATLDPDCQVAGVQIQAGGTGVDFTRSHYAVYFATGLSLGDYEQSRRRLLRPGQTESVRFIHLTAEGTYDEDIAEALATRQNVAQYVGGLIRARQDGRAPVAPTDADVAAAAGFAVSTGEPS